MAILGLPHKSVEEQGSEFYRNRENHEKLRKILAEKSSLLWVPDKDLTAYIWLDADGNVTRDPGKLKEKKRVLVPRNRPPKDERDFHEILERECEKDPSYREIVIDSLIETCKGWISELQSLSSPVDTSDLRKFVAFLEKPPKPSALPPTYESLFRNNDDRTRITKEIKERCQNGRFQGFDTHPKPAIELQIIYKLLSEYNYFKDKKTKEYGSKFAAQKAFYGEFGFTADEKKKEGKQIDIKLTYPQKPSAPVRRAEEDLIRILSLHKKTQ